MKHKFAAFVAALVMLFVLAQPAAAAGPMEVLGDNPQYIAIGLLIGLVLALIVCLIFKAQLKNVRKGTTAENFVSESLSLSLRRDRFTHRTTTRVKIQKKQ